MRPEIANPSGGGGRHDYTPKGVRDLGLLEHFPSLVPTSPADSSWPHLRREVPHVWRTDLRSKKPGIGVLSTEEANVLAHLANQFSGRRGLEIGCHFGWSTAHLASAGLRLDVVDPALADPDHQVHVREPLQAIPASDVRLWAGFSPSVIDAVASVEPEKWSFVLIDGNHDGDAPYRDACAVLPHCAESAMIVFHDLASPAVSAGLAYLQDQGWGVTVMNTMQIMGVAVTGDVDVLEHRPDPETPSPWLEHLERFRA